MYDSSLDNQHKAMRKFRPYAVTSANDNDTYNLTELEATRIVVPVAGKKIKAFKKRHEAKPDPGDMDSYDDRLGTDGNPNGEE